MCVTWYNCTAKHEIQIYGNIHSPDTLHWILLLPIFLLSGSLRTSLSAFLFIDFFVSGVEPSVRFNIYRNSIFRSTKAEPMRRALTFTCMYIFTWTPQPPLSSHICSFLPQFGNKQQYENQQCWMFSHWYITIAVHTWALPFCSGTFLSSSLDVSETDIVVDINSIFRDL